MNYLYITNQDNHKYMCFPIKKDVPDWLDEYIAYAFGDEVITITEIDV